VDTVFVTGDITVNNGITLTIDPGVLVLFTDSFGLHIQGRLLAQGTVADSIRFTMEDTTGYSTNTHTGWGGILFINTPATNDSSIISFALIEFGQTASPFQGGAISLIGVSKLRLSNSLIQYNTAPFGGGMHSRGSAPLIINNTFKKNLATSNGGAISLLYGSDAKIVGNLITSNQAYVTGGGIEVFASNSPLIHNNIIAENSAGVAGGGFRIHYSSNPVLTNNSVVNNSAGSGGGYSMFVDCNPILTNEIVYMNTASSGAQIDTFSNCNPVVSYSNIEGGFSGTGNIDTNPMFINPAGGNYRLLPASPCINAGTPDTTGLGLPLTDLDGNPRVFSCAIDMGAYESQSNLIVGGAITSDTTWASDTVFVHCDVDVADGATLTIDPGVVVMFMDHYAINVQGRILAEGNAVDTILFTSFDTTGYSGNTHSGWGGIRFSSTPPSNDSSIISHSIVEYVRNATYGFGGISAINVSKLRIQNNLVRRNLAVGGGGVFINVNSNPVIRNNTIRENRATEHGGGLLIEGGSNPLVLQNTITGNSSNIWGGGVSVRWGAAPLLTGNLIEENLSVNWGGGLHIFRSTGARVTDNVFRMNHSQYEGGGLAIEWCNPLIDSNTFVKNTAASGGGGIAVVFDDPDSTTDTTKLVGNRINGNDATNAGGGIYAYDCRIIIEGNTIDTNQSNQGGGIYLNQIKYGHLETNLIDTNIAVSNGGGTYINNSSPELRSNVISANQSGENGGGLYLTNASNPTLTGNIVHSNYCQGLGGAINMVFGCSPAIQNDLYYGNVANWKGGAVYADFGSVPVLTNVTIVNNNASDAGGGLVCSSGSNAVIKNSILYGNTAGTSGDNIYLNDDASDPEFHYSIIEGGPAAFAGLGSGANYSGTFVNNLDMDPLFADASSDNYRLLPVSPAINAGTPDTTGLGLPLTDLDGNPRVISCAIDMGAYESQSNLIVGGSISSDTTWASDTVYVHCDVDIADGATLTIDPGVVVLFSGYYTINVQGRILANGSLADSIRFIPSDTVGYASNTHTGWGGIRFNNTPSSNDSSLLQYCVVEYAKNAAILGGGVYLKNFSKLRIDKSRISYCFSSRGAGIYATSNSSPTITNNSITNNNAGYIGGGIYLYSSSSPLIANSIISGNTSPYRAGGMYIDVFSNPTLVNNLITNNSAPEGGGLSMYLSSPHIINTTIADNSASVVGGALQNLSSNPTLINCIVWNNTANSSPGISPGTAIITYSNIQGGWTGTGNVDVDPLFADAANGDFRLLSCSPMINAGDPDTNGLVLPSTDFYGQTRLMHDTVDIGAAEYNGPWPIPQIDIWAAKDVFCQDDAGEKIFVAPAGGQLSGPGVGGGHFYPAFAGPGQHWLYYSVADSVACPTQDSLLMTVHPLPSVVHPALQVCEDVPSLVLAGGSPATGTYSGAYVSAGLFDVQAAGVGSHSVDYTYTDLLTNCTRTISFAVMVTPLPVVDFPDPAPACNQSGLLTLSATPAGGSFSGAFVTGNAFDTDASGEGSFTAYYSYADSNGCVNTDSASITVLPLPTLSLTADTSVCPGECVQLQASGGISYRWNTGYKFASFNACPTQTTTYSVTLTDVNGCTAAGNVTITVNPLPAANAGANDTICPGDSTMLGAGPKNKFHNYYWSNGASGLYVMVSPATTTTYTLTVVDRLTGCSATDQVTVVVRPAPVASASYADTVCPGDCTDLTATGGVSYAWSSGGTAAVETVCPDVPTSYTVTVTDAFGCSAEASVSVPVHPAVAADAGADQTICQGESALLQASGGNSYVWMSPASQTGAQISVSPLQDQKYYVEVTSAEGCTAIDSVMVYVNDSVSLSISGADTIQPGDTTLLTANVSGGLPPYSYSWSPMDFVLNDNGSSLETAPVVNTAYSLSVLDANGCARVRTHLIAVDHPGAVAAGRITYANIWNSPINQATVFLKDMSKSSPIVDSTLTDDRGFFYFNGLDTATYLIEPALNGRWGWGGVNATDGLMVALHFVNLVNLQGVFLGAADVDTSNYVNATDALAISQRFTGLIPGFAAGDWHFPETLIPANGQSGPTPWVEIQTLNYGDVNASNIPSLKVSPKVEIASRGMIAAEEVRALGLPIILDASLEAGALSLIIQTSLASQVRDIKMAEGLEGSMHWNSEGNELRLSWFSLQPVDLLAGEVLCRLILDPAALNGMKDIQMRISGNSEISDGLARPYAGAKLYHPEVNMEALASSLSVWPNPATENVQLLLNLAGEGQAVLLLQDIRGRLIETLHSAWMDSGEHSLSIRVGHLPSGTYLLRFEQSGEVPLSKKLLIVR
jgi:parallel beta-helix repeat protein